MKETSLHDHLFNISLKKHLAVAPTFPISGPRGQEVGESFVVKKRRTADFEATHSERVGWVN